MASSRRKPPASRLPPKGRRFIEAPDSDVFCENSRYLKRDGIKRRLKRRGVPQVCALCSQDEVWNGRPLILHLDHINGVYNDNRIENLRLVCPNCHSQTETYAGRTGKPILPRVECRFCSHSNRPSARRCAACSRWLVKHPGRYKIEWPDIDDLKRMVAASTCVAVSAQLGVDESAVRRRLRAIA